MAAKPEAIARPQADLIRALSRVLADTYLLYLETHNFHWNVEGPRFRSLHEMFEEQYQALWNSVDEIAERIRALGQYAPGTYAKFKALASVKETEEIPPADEMLDKLIADNQTLVNTIKTALFAAQTASDDVTTGLLTERLTYHDKQLWMMKSMRQR